MRNTQRIGFLLLQMSCLSLILPSGITARVAKGFHIAGRIQDESGTKVWGAQVELRDATWRVLLATTSTRNGYFRFSQITAGQYEIAVAKRGFVTSYSPISVPLKSHSELKLALMKENERHRLGPEVIVSEPFDMTPLQNTAKISAHAKDCNGVTRTEIYIERELEASTPACAISLLWDTTEVPNGKYLILVKAYSRAGAVGESQEVMVLVRNN
jgi:hypothetical protein